MNSNIVPVSLKNNLIKLLSTIKHYYGYYLSVSSNLDVIITKLEELLSLIYNASFQVNTQQHICDQRILELFYFCFTLNTNSVFYDLFFKLFLKYLNQINIANGDNDNQNPFLHFLSHYRQIYTSLLNRKIEYIGISTDIKSMVNVLKCLYIILVKFEQNSISDLNLNELLTFFFQTNNNMFNMTKSMNHLDQYSKIINKVFTLLLNSKVYKDQIDSIFNQLVNKILDISRIKEETVNVIDDQEQNYQVDTLLVCLKVCSQGMKAKDNIILLTYETKLKLTKCLIELSFWDNPNVVNYVCKILTLIWRSAITIKVFGMRNEIEKMIEFIYLRHFIQYYDSLSNPSSDLINDENKLFQQKIKLAVLELLIQHLHHLIENENFLYITYLINDNNKFRINTINEIFSALQKYFNLKEPQYSFLKKSLIILFQTCFVKIKEKVTTSSSIPNSNVILINQEKITDKWLDIFKHVNEGKFKTMYKQICDDFNMDQLTKKQKRKDVSDEIITKHTMIAKAIAILIRFSNTIDINLLFEIMGDNHIMSNLILEEYAKTFNFKGLDIIQSYELFVSTFKLTGEQSHIYNFIYSFSRKFFDDNKNETKDTNFYFKSDEEVTSFAYSIMMLNTDLHNPNVTNHMSCEEFIKNNVSSKLFDDIPKEYIKKIYNRIQSNALKVAQPRQYNFNKTEELYLSLNSLHCYNVEKEELNNKNIFNELISMTKESLLQYPLLNLCESIYINSEDKEIINLICDCSIMLYDDLFCCVLSLPQIFYEFNDENILALLETICSLSSLLKKKYVIDKLVRTINSFMSNTKSIRLYNLFFKLSINYVEEFHSYLEIYYKAMLDIITFQIIEDKNKLQIDYTKLIDEIIYKTFSALNEKKKRNRNDSTFFNMIFFSGSSQANEEETSFDSFKALKYHQMEIDSPINSSSSSVKQEDVPIKLSEILEIIKHKDEEFIFFATHSASKIVEYQSKNEFYLSMIFLNEILQGISQNQFIKIWQNLFNIFISKIEFKKECNNSNDLFDYLFIDCFLYQILSQNFPSIENNDYYQLLENYINIDNIEVLFIILENNDKLIDIGRKQNKHLNDQIIHILLFLIQKEIEMMTRNNMHNIQLTKLIKVITFFNNIIVAIKDMTILNQDSLKEILKILQLLYDINVVYLLCINNFDFELVSLLMFSLSNKLSQILPPVNDDKWDVYLYIAQFCFKCALVEKEEVQIKFMEILVSIFETPKIPLVRYNYIITMLVNWYTPYLKLKVKYSHYWDDVFNLFYLCVVNNDEIKLANNEIEQLWSLFVRKYLLSFIDEEKKDKKEISEESIKIIEKMYINVKQIVLSFGEKVVWWESSKNFLKLYFPRIISD